MIWIEIVKKRYDEVCDNIYRSSIAIQSGFSEYFIPIHDEVWFFLVFLIKGSLNFDILL